MEKFDDTGLYEGKYKGWIETYTSKANPWNLQKSDIKLADIAHSLSLMCRYNGHCRVFYSVAEHCTRVAEIVEPKAKLAALLHDAAEAYFGDVIRPLKLNMPDIVKAEAAALATIYEKFNVRTSEEMTESIRLSDNIVGATEARDLMASGGESWGKLPEPLPSVIVPSAPAHAEIAFLEAFFYYGGIR